MQFYDLNSVYSLANTLYGVDEIKFLHSRLGKNVGLLYIDAPLQDRITREYTRLRTDSPYSDRKADLTVTREQIEEQTKRKDEKKRMAGAFDLKRLAINENGKLEINDNALVHFADVINNDGDIEQTKAQVDKFINDLNQKQRLLTRYPDPLFVIFIIDKLILVHVLIITFLPNAIL